MCARVVCDFAGEGGVCAASWSGTCSGESCGARRRRAAPAVMFDHSDAPYSHLQHQLLCILKLLRDSAGLSPRDWPARSERAFTLERGCGRVGRPGPWRGLRRWGGTCVGQVRGAERPGAGPGAPPRPRPRCARAPTRIDAASGPGRSSGRWGGASPLRRLVASSWRYGHLK